MYNQVENIEPGVGSSEIVLDTDKTPWLLDHQFQSITIAPGALLVASILESEQSAADIKFENMIPVSESLPGRVAIVQDQSNIAFRSIDGKTQYASLTLGGGPAPTSENGDFVSGEARELYGSQLYNKLKGQGNDYGPAFQVITNIKSADDGWEATWQVVEEASSLERMTVLLDSLTHVVAGLGGISSSYFLNGFGSVTVDGSITSTNDLRIRTAGVRQSGYVFSADFDICTAEGSVVATVKGVELSVQRQSTTTESIAIASTFTTDPLTDVFDFWSGQLGVNFVPEYADYGQLMQSLLSTNSALDIATKSKVLLVRLEDLVRSRTEVEYVKPDSFPSALETRELPDGRVVAQLNKYETDYLYQEIFVDQAYKRHNMRVLDGDTVIDIGANIGFFSLFASSQANDVKIVAIEPSPVVLPILKANLAAYSPAAQVIEGGASSAIGQAEFTAYRKSSVFSSFSADSAEDREAIAKIVRNSLEAGGYSDQGLVDKTVDEFMVDRMDAEQFMCQLISVSDVIDQLGLTHVGLLKIDAEKSEEEIVAGIRDEHWSMIDQVVVEVHLQSGMSVNTILEKLKQEGFVCIEDEEELLEDSGLVTVYAMRPERIERNAEANQAEYLGETTDLLTNSLEQFVTRTNSALDVVLCPSNLRDPDLLADMASATDRINSKFAEDSRVSVLSAEEYIEHYPVDTVFDPVAEIQGHIPYTQEWYAAIATSMVRKHLERTRMPSKVLVMDCDNTLWKGIVGETGVQGIEFGENNLALMKFAQKCKAAGMILCLASKNDEDTVKEAFESRSSDMPLQWSDIVSSRINWNRKSDNLREMANELNLGLDSFVFLDDSPIECAEVRLNCPEVFVVEMDEEHQWDDFLTHLWAVDQPAATAEDAKRTSMYQHEQKRMQYKSSTASLKEFIEGLGIEMNIAGVDESSINRASQMTMRTNQFNLTTKRRSVAEIAELQGSGYEADVITVSDRFGDYGITGLLMYKADGTTLSVDTFLLSCRVLGREIESKLVNYLAEKAEMAGASSIEFSFSKTAKNEPARMFLDSLGSAPSDQESFTIQIAVDEAKQFTGAKAEAQSDEPADQTGDAESKSVAPAQAAIKPEQYISVAHKLRSVSSILTAMTTLASKERPDLESAFVAPQSENEREMCELWCQLLGYSQIGINDDFFELGGTSLKAVKLVSMLADSLGRGVSVVSVFEKPTVAGLTGIVYGNQVEEDFAAQRSESKSRAGARRQSRRDRQAKSAR